MDKILKVQSEIGVLVKTETNPFFKSKYMDINGLLEQLLPLLEKHGLTVIQPLSNIYGKPAIETTVIDLSAAERNTVLVSSKIPLPITIWEKNKDGIGGSERPLTSQEFGGAITYFRRYSLQSLFLLRAEDDDANVASSNKSKKITETEDLPF